MENNIFQRIDLFWERKLTLEEQKQLLKELEQQDQELYHSVKNAFDQQHFSKSELLLTDEEYKTVLDKVHERAGINQSRKKTYPLYKKWLVAATILISFAIGYLIYQQQAAHTVSLDDRIVHSDSTTLTNEKSINQVAILPDQSKITLFPKSSIRYASNYGQSDRKIELQGKAKFEVAHDSIRPFVVYSNGYSTTALGTVFIVETFSIHKVSVNLLSGKVRVDKVNKAGTAMPVKILNAGDQLHIADNKIQFIPIKPKKVKRTSVAKNEEIEIKPISDSIVFEDQPLAEVFSTLARVKKIKVDFDQELVKGKTFTGEFSASNSIEIILNIICQMNDLTYDQKEDGIQISKTEKNLFK